jgi:hypothetical protein
MQLTCPNCGQPVPSENINIQRMAAVCPACHNVFQFDPSAAKYKRQKVKQPQHIEMDETDEHLNIAFHTNFRLEKNQAFVSSVMLSVVFTVITSFLLTKGVGNPVNALVTLSFGALTLLFYYWLALVAYNKTHIDVDDENIQVSRKPIPYFLKPASTIPLAGVESIRYEETPASKKEGYDTPRYNVWAESVDGTRKLIVGDLVEEYAVFVSQRLNALLNADADLSRLVDQEEGQLSDTQSTAPSQSRLN